MAIKWEGVIGIAVLAMLAVCCVVDGIAGLVNSVLALRKRRKHKRLLSKQPPAKVPSSNLGRSLFRQDDEHAPNAPQDARGLDALAERSRTADTNSPGTASDLVEASEAVARMVLLGGVGGGGGNVKPEPGSGRVPPLNCGAGYIAGAAK